MKRNYCPRESKQVTKAQGSHQTCRTGKKVVLSKLALKRCAWPLQVFSIKCCLELCYLFLQSWKGRESLKGLELSDPIWREEKKEERELIWDLTWVEFTGTGWRGHRLPTLKKSCEGRPDKYQHVATLQDKSAPSPNPPPPPPKKRIQIDKIERLCFFNRYMNEKISLLSEYSSTRVKLKVARDAHLLSCSHSTR